MISFALTSRAIALATMLLMFLTGLLWPLTAVAEAIDGTAAHGPRLALVIGNGAYQHIKPLTNPPKDARLMARTLKQLGFTVIEGKPGEPLVDADRKAMSRVIGHFIDQLHSLGPTAVGLFFYAGHGVQSQADGKNYLIPVDVDISSEQELEDEAVSANSVLRKMEITNPGVKIVILDACRDNPFRSLVRSTKNGLIEMDASPSAPASYEVKPRGSLIAYSTAPGGLATDGSGDNSPYTMALAKALTVPGVEIRNVFNTVTERVAEATKGRQQPWISSSLVGQLYLSKAAVAIQSHALGNLLTPQEVAELDNISDPRARAAFISRKINEQPLFNTKEVSLMDSIYDPQARASFTLQKLNQREQLLNNILANMGAMVFLTPQEMAELDNISDPRARAAFISRKINEQPLFNTKEVSLMDSIYDPQARASFTLQKLNQREQLLNNILAKELDDTSQ